ncbi:EAL domain-containing protein [Aminipila butyrica]|uniref:EAL domain-containing protein n=1 Tax=Aminipila butyrica TaxID=433296 RepID=A0A858BZI0_9FIRM|nr:EAL domain-containing protein [Aminipila butyrica]QIB70340.1 EAL domain-containing protein [Aminipila butyrica]
MVFKAAERFFLTLEVDIDSMTVVLIKDGREGRTYDASQYFQYFVEYGGRDNDVAQLQKYFSMEFFQDMLVTGKGSETFECCMLFDGEDYKFLKCEIKLLESKDSNIIKIVMEDVSHKRVEQLEDIRKKERKRPPKPFVDNFGIKFDHRKELHMRRMSRYRVITIAICLLCMTVSLLFFYNLYHQRLIKVADATLQDCQNANQFIEGELEDISHNLFTLKNLLSTVGGQLDKKQSLQYLMDEQMEYGYESIFFADSAGRVLSNQEGAKVAGSGGVTSFSYSRSEGIFVASDYFNSKAFISYKIPMKELKFEGHSYNSLVTILDLHKLCNSIFTAGDLEGQDLVIVDQTGNILWGKRGEIPELKSQKNFFEYLSQPSLELNPAYNQAVLIDHLTDKQSGTFDFVEDGQRRFGAYMPLPIEDLYLISLVKGETLRTEELKLLFAGLAWGACLLLLLSVFRYQSRRIQGEKAGLAELAYVDDVTGGMNSYYFDLQAKELVKQVQCQYVLVDTNLRDFGQYSERYGHIRGNELIRTMFLGIAQRIDGDELLCRYYAEHMMILMKYEGKEQLEKRLVQMGKCIIETSFKLEFGVCVIRDVTMDLGLIKRRTALALKEQNGKNLENVVVSYYDGELLEKIIFEKKLETTMYRAFRNSEFKIFVAPRYQLKKRSLCNGDAYAVWIHPEKGPLMPEQYLSVFERRGLVMRLDTFIFEEVCRLLREHLDKGRDCMPISITLHWSHFNVEEFIDKFKRIKERYNIPGELLSFEVTEELLYEKSSLLRQLIDSIHEMGSSCIIGEYQGRTLSLGKMSQLPADYIKFGPSLLTQDFPAAMIRSILGMVQSFQAGSIVTGVSEQSQLAFLMDCNCDEAKGDIFAKDIPLRDYINIL